MKRLILFHLDAWKTRSHRSPLLIRGARQVGKTWVLREFGKTFAACVELNLEARTELHATFRELFGKPQELIRALSLVTGEKIIPGRTLLFLDEIQSAKEALQALRYFKEELPDLHVVAAGSLLEFAIRELGFPVGRIETLHLFPLNFEEYLAAKGREDLIQAIKDMESRPLPSAVHEALVAETASYCMVGGMPEVLDTFLRTQDFQETQNILQKLVTTYRDDFYKYAGRSRIEHLRMVFDGCPRLIGKKFKYAELSSDYKSRELSQALELLCEAGLFYKAHHTAASGLPLKAQIKANHFKVFGVDVGLANRVLGLPLSDLFLRKKELFVHRGALAEQLAAQEWLSYTPPNEAPEIFYWHREAKSSQAEVDLMVEWRGRPLPLEVKAGAKRTGKSLSLFMEEKKGVADRAFLVSAGPYHKGEKIVSLPLYGFMMLRRD